MKILNFNLSQPVFFLNKCLTANFMAYGFTLQVIKIASDLILQEQELSTSNANFQLINPQNEPFSFHPTSRFRLI